MERVDWLSKSTFVGDTHGRALRFHLSGSGEGLGDWQVWGVQLACAFVLYDLDVIGKKLGRFVLRVFAAEEQLGDVTIAFTTTCDLRQHWIPDYRVFPCIVVIALRNPSIYT